jgi:membrane-bound inhibitor of C-type lysozyme
VSGSGARYANSNESFVFWNKGNTAFIEENGKTTYSNCTTKR